MSAKAKSKLTPEQQKATMTRVLQKIKPYGFSWCAASSWLL